MADTVEILRPDYLHDLNITFNWQIWDWQKKISGQTQRSWKQVKEFRFHSLTAVETHWSFLSLRVWLSEPCQEAGLMVINNGKRSGAGGDLVESDCMAQVNAAWRQMKGYATAGVEESMLKDMKKQAREKDNARILSPGDWNRKREGEHISSEGKMRKSVWGHIQSFPPGI